MVFDFFINYYINKKNGYYNQEEELIYQKYILNKKYHQIHLKSKLYLENNLKINV